MATATRTKPTSPVPVFGLLTKPDSRPAALAARALAMHLAHAGARVLLDQRAAPAKAPRPQKRPLAGSTPSGASPLPDGVEVVDEATLGARAGFVVTLGGDGTLIHAVRFLRDAKGQPRSHTVPVLGLNVGGTLGFLAEKAPAHVDGYRDLAATLVAGQYRIEARDALEVSQVRHGRAVSTHLALNDAVLSEGPPAQLVSLMVLVDGVELTTYRADGLIVSTPTGSTAYSLSAGGPILHPRVRATVLTPICPHRLTHRPIVVPGTSEIEVRVVSRERTLYLSTDGHSAAELGLGDSVRIRARAGRVQLARLDLATDSKSTTEADAEYFDRLRSKLNWGR
jgi:NAD+ kinase